LEMVRLFQGIYMTNDENTICKADNIKTTPVLVPDENVMYVTGATAQTKSLEISLKALCFSTSSSKTFITLTDGSATPAAVGYKCAAPAAATYPKMTGVTGPWIVLKNEGSSGDAQKGVRSATDFAQLALTNCTLGTAASNLNSGTCVGTETKPAYLGLSDVSEAVTRAKSQLQALASGYTYGVKATGSGQGFGVAVSPLLYTALKTDQGLNAKTGMDAIPSVSKSQMATLYSSNETPWNALLPNTPQTEALTLARRSTTSGTHAAAEIYFLGNPCTAGNAPLGGSINAFESNQSTGAGRTAYTQTLNSATSNVLASVGSTSIYSIGVVSLENLQPASSWKYVKVNGAFPWNPAGTANSDTNQRTNILNGTYDFAFETYLFWSTRGTLTASLRNNIVDFKNALVGDDGLINGFMPVGANLLNSPGLFGDPLAAGADLGDETNHYSRGGNECAVATRKW
jgi:hypothetical protein